MVTTILYYTYLQVGDVSDGEDIVVPLHLQRRLHFHPSPLNGRRQGACEQDEATGTRECEWRSDLIECSEVAKGCWLSL